MTPSSVSAAIVALGLLAPDAAYAYVGAGAGSAFLGSCVAMLYEFLADRGKEGWEVVGMAGVREGSEIVLKRPLLEEEPLEEPV